jgi:hypothetical protein
MDLDPQIIWDRANLIPVKDAHLAALSGIDRSYFSRIRSGALGFTLPQFQTLIRLFPRLEEIKRRSGLIPVDWTDISGVKRMLATLEDEARNPPSAPTASDWALLVAVSDNTKTPAGIAEELNVPLSDLSKLMVGASKRFDFVVNQLAARSDDIAALIELNSK